VGEGAKRVLAGPPSRSFCEAMDVEVEVLIGAVAVITPRQEWHIHRGAIILFGVNNNTFIAAIIPEASFVSGNHITSSS